MGRSLLIFLAIGLAWAAQIAGFLRTGAFLHDAGIEPALYSLVPVATMLVGGFGLHLHHRSRHVPAEIPIVALVLGTGAFTGITVGFLWWPPDGIPSGAQSGLAIAAGSLPILLPAMRVMARLDQPGKWAVAGCMVAATSLLTLPRWNPYPTVSDRGSALGLIAGGLGVVATLFAQAALTRAPRQSIPVGSPYRTGTLDLPDVPSSARVVMGCAAVSVLAVLAAALLW